MKGKKCDSTSLFNISFSLSLGNTPFYVNIYSNAKKPCEIVTDSNYSVIGEEGNSSHLHPSNVGSSFLPNDSHFLLEGKNATNNKKRICDREWI